MSTSFQSCTKQKQRMSEDLSIALTIERDKLFKFFCNYFILFSHPLLYRNFVSTNLNRICPVCDKHFFTPTMREIGNVWDVKIDASVFTNAEGLCNTVGLMFTRKEEARRVVLHTACVPNTTRYINSACANDGNVAAHEETAMLLELKNYKFIKK